MKILLILLLACSPCLAGNFNDNGATIGQNTAVGSFRLTKLGEGQLLMYNKTGHATKSGELYVSHRSYDNSVTTAPVSTVVPIGVSGESGVADGGLHWVTVFGRAQYLIADSTGSIDGGWISPSTTQSGRVQTFSTEPSQPTFSTTEHDGECGHSMEAKSQGTDVLFWGFMHFR